MITARNVSKEWNNGNKITALHNINFSIKKGEFISIIGPSGCGKTTLLRLLAGLIKTTEGEITIKSTTTTKNRKLSIVFQKPSLLPWRNVIDNVTLPIELDKSLRFKDARKAIKLVGLDKFSNYYPGELSGGMEQRVAIARALVVRPELLLMDEPFGALDEIKRDELNKELLNIHKSIKSTTIFITHSISEAIFLSDRIIILSKNPSTIKNILPINLPKDRDSSIKDTKEFQEYEKCLRKILKE